MRRESDERNRRMRLADDLVAAFLEGDRETYVKALALRNAVTADAILDPALLGDLHDALRKAVLLGAARRVLSDFEAAFPAPSSGEGAAFVTAPAVRDLQGPRLEAAEEAFALLKDLGDESAEKARHLRNLLADEKLPPREIVAAVGEALLDALMNPEAGTPGKDGPVSREPARLRQAYKKMEDAFGDLLR